MAHDDIAHDISPNRPRKKRSRIGLFAPLVFVVLLAAGWSGYWFYVRHEVEQRIDTHRAHLVSRGYQVTLNDYSVRGYPFRMFVTFDGVTVIAPNGKGFAAPQLKAEANAYALDKWVMVAPRGLTWYRGRVDGQDRGHVAITGRSLRGSVSGLFNPIYNVAIEGLDVTMAPSDPARPFAFTTADKVDLYLRPAKDAANSADFLVRVSGARGQPRSLIGDFSPQGPMSLHLEGTLDHYSTLGSGLNAWAAAGGQATAVKSQITTADLSLMFTSDGLSAGADGRLRGQMKIEMDGSFNPIDALAALRLISPENVTAVRPLLNLTLATQGTQKLTLDFRDGGAWLGPLKLADAPALP